MKTGSGVKEVEDLDGKAIALPINTTPERLIKALIEEKKLKVKIVPVRDNSEGFLAFRPAAPTRFPPTTFCCSACANPRPIRRTMKWSAARCRSIPMV